MKNELERIEGSKHFIIGNAWDMHWALYSSDMPHETTGLALLVGGLSSTSLVDIIMIAVNEDVKVR